MVRLIELKNPVGFENAEFFPLYENAKQTRAPDWVAEEEVELRPGESRELKLRVQDASRYVEGAAEFVDAVERMLTA